MITSFLAGALLLQTRPVGQWLPQGTQPVKWAQTLDQRIANLRGVSLKFEVQAATRIGKLSGQGEGIFRSAKQFRLKVLTVGLAESEGVYWDLIIADGRKVARQYRGKWRKQTPASQLKLLQPPLVSQTPERLTEWMFAPLVSREAYFARLVREARAKGLVTRVEARKNLIEGKLRDNERLVIERPKAESKKKGTLFFEFITDRKTGLLVGVSVRLGKQETFWRSAWNLEPAQRYAPSQFAIPKEAK